MTEINVVELAPSPGSAAMPGYGPGAQLFHWITAALMLLILIPIGLYSEWSGEGALRAYLLDHWHKPTGLLVILITVTRLLWKKSRPPVAEANGLTWWESIAARSAHWILYALLLGMPLSGLLMSEGAGRPTSFFGLFTLPQFIALDPHLSPRDQPMYKFGKLLHNAVLSWPLYVVVTVHIAGAIKHSLFDAHPNYFRRMWNFRKVHD